VPHSCNCSLKCQIPVDVAFGHPLFYGFGRCSLLASARPSAWSICQIVQPRIRLLSSFKMSQLSPFCAVACAPAHNLQMHAPITTLCCDFSMDLMRDLMFHEMKHMSWPFRSVFRSFDRIWRARVSHRSLLTGTFGLCDISEPNVVVVDVLKRRAIMRGFASPFHDRVIPCRNNNRNSAKTSF